MDFFSIRSFADTSENGCRDNKTVMPHIKTINIETDNIIVFRFIKFITPKELPFVIIKAHFKMENGISVILKCIYTLFTLCYVFIICATK